MEETDLNRIIAKSLHWGHKLPDPQGQEVYTASKRPFDGFGVTPNHFVYFESKFMKGLESFNYKNRVEDHQWENLLDIKRINKLTTCVITLGIWAPRDFKVMAFEANYLWDRMQKGIPSLKAKELQSLLDKNLFVKVEKDMIDIELLLSKIISS
jgi:penicillin-binding protein-related factor A (putative recombinase)